MSLEHALRYGERSVPVFPVRGKLPLTPHGFKDASTNSETIRALWELYPGAGIAMPTGSPSGLIVLDIDPRHGGNESLAVLETKHSALPETLESRTGGGGRHLFFTPPDGQLIRNSAGKLGPGLDVRGDGGYVVMPPSLHPETGECYTWARKLKAAPLPAWLTKLLAEAPAAPTVTATAAAIPDGQRNDTLARLAGTMRRKGCTQDTILAALLTENQQRCKPPLPEVEVRSIAASISRYPAVEDHEYPPASAPTAPDTPAHHDLPAFPPAAWRGVFEDYRKAMERATEAADAFHFASLWARAAVALARRVSFPYSMTLYPNVYLVGFGTTGDRKTTAMRKGTDLGGDYKIIRGGGSGEGVADEFSNGEPGQGFLLFAEEFSQVLRPGRWEGSTLIPMLTQCFDCPPRYEMKFRKAPVNLERPTPSLLAGTTPEWFWQDFRARDFQGGFGNRLFFVTGTRKAAIALPETPNLHAVAQSIDALSQVEACELRLTADAERLFGRYYEAWDAEESKRDALFNAAVKRIPAYVLKLAMLYAAFERTLPEIQADQLAAAILVGRYGEHCARELLSLQNSATNPTKELERRILAFVNEQPGKSATKRLIYKSLHRHYSTAEAFNRAFESLVRAGELFTQSASRCSILVSTEPF